MAHTAEMSVRIADDGGRAILVVPPAHGASGLDPAMVAALTKAAGVVIDPEVERAIAGVLSAYKPTASEQTHVLARAVAAVPGKDGFIEWSPGFDPLATQKEAAEGSRTDHHAGPRYVRVEAGDIVGAWREPTGGSDGRDVRGNVDKAIRGASVPFTLHPSLTRDSQSRIVSQSEGVLIVRDGQVLVSEWLRLPGALDFSTGNVDFSGSVEVVGGIASGFKLKAGKSAIVGGLIECAEIECNGDFDARGGLVGHGKGTLRVGGNARIVYAEKLGGEITGDLLVERELVDCKLSVGRGLQCPNGTILGGQVSVTGSINIKSLGSPSDTPTTVVLGDVPLLDAARGTLVAAIDQINSSLRQFAERERMIRLNPRPTPADRERLTELSYEVSQLNAELTRQRASLDAVETTRRARQKCDVHVAMVIHPRVKLLVGGFSVTFKRAVKGPLWIGWDQNRNLIYKSSAGVVRPLSDVALVLETENARASTRATAAAA